MIEYLPAIVWDTDTFVTHSAMANQSLIHLWLTDGFLESVFHTGSPVYAHSYKVWLPCLLNEVLVCTCSEKKFLDKGIQYCIQVEVHLNEVVDCCHKLLIDKGSQCIADDITIETFRSHYLYL